MTRKDYELIAGALMAARKETECKEPEECAEDLNDGVSYARDFLAEALQADNPRFDREKFLKACEID